MYIITALEVGMLRIAICCGEGFASGFLAKRLDAQTAKLGLKGKCSFIFIPFVQLYDRQNEVDIAFLMAHVEAAAKADKREYSIPLYVMPYKVAAATPPNVYFEDAEDLMAMANGKGGLICFPGEEMSAIVNRNKSHRSTVKR